MKHSESNTQMNPIFREPSTGSVADVPSDFQIWFRRRIYLRTAVFLVSFVSAALIIFLLQP